MVITMYAVDSVKHVYVTVIHWTHDSQHNWNKTCWNWKITV